MEFRHSDGRLIPVFLPPRSVMIMTGESRYLWSHGITPRKSDIVPVSLLNRDSLAAGSGDKENASTHEVAKDEVGDCGAHFIAKKLPERLTLLKRGIRTSFTFRKLLDNPDTYGKLHSTSYHHLV